MLLNILYNLTHIVHSLEKTEIQRENDKFVDTQAPIIVSANRSADILACYTDWFFDRLEKGYSAWTNPFNGVTSYISYANTRLIAFLVKRSTPVIEIFSCF